MNIEAENLGKRFNKEWIFKKFSFNFQSDRSYAVTGPNGSGKSTLLQVISGLMPFSEGELKYTTDQNIPSEDIYQYISLAAPYQELVEEFTLTELLNFHLNFKKFKSGLSGKDFIEKIQLNASANKELRYFSSGMKQRVKLALAMYSESSILLLDEPTSNLDAKGIQWYQDEIVKNISDRITIICSNQKHEYEFCGEMISLEDYK